jgi:PDZ domain-containing protein
METSKRGWRNVGIAGGILFALAIAALIVLYLVPSNDYILLPDRAHPVAPLVDVKGGKDPTGPGGIYFVDVFERRASVFESIFPSIHKGSTLVPAKLIVPPGVSDKAARQADLRSMSISQRVAAAVALRRLGYKVTAKPSGVIVSALDSSSHAVGKLRPADVITEVNGVPTPTIAALRRELAKVKPGETVRLGISRSLSSNAGQDLTVDVKTIAAGKRAIVGFAPEQAANIHLPIKVSIDAGNVGGPSAGLAFALEVMEELGRNVDHGYKVAATGEINLDGTVSAIGGVKQKTYGVRKSGADVFLVPVDGDNAKEAKRYAGGLRIIPVTSFPQALRALATLPPKR